MNNEIKLTDNNFHNEVLDSKTPVLVDFYADWCFPCKMVAPILSELSSEYTGKLKIGKLNTDENYMTASQYGISGIPTLLLFKNGEVVEKMVGALPKHLLKEKLNYFLTDETYKN